VYIDNTPPDYTIDFENIEGNFKQYQRVHQNWIDDDQCAGDSCGGTDYSATAWCNAYGYEAQGSCLIDGWCECSNYGVDCYGGRTVDIEYFLWEC